MVWQRIHSSITALQPNLPCNLNDKWLTQYDQIDPNEGFSLLGQSGFRVQCAEVVVPPWNIHYLQRKTLYRQFHGPVFWNQVMNPCSPLRQLGFPPLSALSSTTPVDSLACFKSSLDALTNSSQLTVSKIANPIALLTTKQTEILGGLQRSVSTDTMRWLSHSSSAASSLPSNLSLHESAKRGRMQKKKKCRWISNALCVSLDLIRWLKIELFTLYTLYIPYYYYHYLWVWFSAFSVCP